MKSPLALTGTSELLEQLSAFVPDELINRHLLRLLLESQWVNRLGLSQMFLNSLRLTWIFGLLADTVLLLRARALLSRPPTTELLHELIPKQLRLEGLEDE
jgi:hypothetical protein